MFAEQKGLPAGVDHFLRTAGEGEVFWVVRVCYERLEWQRGMNRGGFAQQKGLSAGVDQFWWAA